MRKNAGRDKKVINGKWKKELDNEDSIIWSNKSDKANLRVIAKRLTDEEWEMRPEINNKLGPEIKLTSRRCAVSMISSMKEVLDEYLMEANNSGKTIEEVIRDNFSV